MLGRYFDALPIINFMYHQSNFELGNFFDLSSALPCLDLEESSPSVIGQELLSSTDRRESQTVESRDNIPKKRNRRDNNLFKIPLSVFFKTLKKEAKRNRSAFTMIKDAYQHKNLSTFPKMILVLRQFQIDKEIGSLFEKAREKFFGQMKKARDQKDHEELEKMFKKMMLCLETEAIEEIMGIYWQGFKQKGKFEQSMDQVRKFHRDLLQRLQISQKQQNPKKRMSLERFGQSS